MIPVVKGHSAKPQTTFQCVDVLKTGVVTHIWNALNVGITVIGKLGLLGQERAN